MKKIIPLRAKRKSEGRTPRPARNQPLSSPHTEDEEGVIALLRPYTNKGT